MIGLNIRMTSRKSRDCPGFKMPQHSSVNIVHNGGLVQWTAGQQKRLSTNHQIYSLHKNQLIHFPNEDANTSEILEHSIR